MLRDSQERYKEACHRSEAMSPGECHSYIPTNIPGSPHVGMPMSLKSNVDQKDILKEVPTPPLHSPSEVSSQRSSPEPVTVDLLGVTSPSTHHSTLSLPPPATNNRADPPLRRTTSHSHRPVSATYSLSPPPAHRTRSTRRLGTLKQLHDKCKSVDVMYLWSMPKPFVQHPYQRLDSPTHNQKEK